MLDDYSSFAPRRAALQCDILMDCDPSGFQATFVGRDEEKLNKCLAEYSKRYAKQGTERVCEQGCEYLMDAGDTCLEQAETVSCNDWDSGALQQTCGEALWACD